MKILILVLLVLLSAILLHVSFPAISFPVSLLAGLVFIVFIAGLVAAVALASGIAERSLVTADGSELRRESSPERLRNTKRVLAAAAIIFGCTVILAGTEVIVFIVAINLSIGITGDQSTNLPFIVYELVTLPAIWIVAGGWLHIRKAWVKLLVAFLASVPLVGPLLFGLIAGIRRHRRGRELAEARGVPTSWRLSFQDRPESESALKARQEWEARLERWAARLERWAAEAEAKQSTEEGRRAAEEERRAANHALWGGMRELNVWFAPPFLSGLGCAWLLLGPLGPAENESFFRHLAWLVPIYGISCASIGARSLHWRTRRPTPSWFKSQPGWLPPKTRRGWMLMFLKESARIALFPALVVWGLILVPSAVSMVIGTGLGGWYLGARSRCPRGASGSNSFAD